ncbi:MAG: hypothetical protein IT381_24190 [Deltaproteobacteria bacterium]|nr:hypothetical protein [Deltaproteobacteria bacterium]
MLILTLCAVLAADGGWTEIENKKGVVIERRPYAGSPYPELRLQTKSRFSPEHLAAAVWTKKDGKYERMKKLSKTLFESPTERVRYEQIATPVISDRDYTVRIRLLVDRANKLFQMTYASDNTMGPPPDPKFVRIVKMSGVWTFEPADDGGTFVTYLAHSDPAGSLPAFLAKGAQIDAARDVWQELDAYAAAHPDVKL